MLWRPAMRPRAVTTCLLRTPLSLPSGPCQAHHPSLAHRSHIPPHRRYASRRTARTLRGQASHSQQPHPCPTRHTRPPPHPSSALPRVTTALTHITPTALTPIAHTHSDPLASVHTPSFPPVAPYTAPPEAHRLAYTYARARCARLAAPTHAPPCVPAPAGTHTPPTPARVHALAHPPHTSSHSPSHSHAPAPHTCTPTLSPAHPPARAPAHPPVHPPPPAHTPAHAPAPHTARLGFPSLLSPGQIAVALRAAIATGVSYFCGW